MKQVWDGFKKLVKKGNEEGIPFFYAKDSTTGKPSSTLYFTYMTFMLAFIANVCLIIRDVFIGTYVAIGFWALALVFYLMRRIDTFRVDIDDGEVMLKSGNDKDDKEQQTGDKNE